MSEVCCCDIADVVAASLVYKKAENRIICTKNVLISIGKCKFSAFFSATGKFDFFTCLKNIDFKGFFGHGHFCMFSEPLRSCTNDAIFCNFIFYFRGDYI